ncbi:OmpA family protein [Sulfurospirillum multivorans]|uniref:OmpA domain-containing protein n=2 Tax=Sulfurospirillum multivorans TaxID=66821 RepID=A0AA86AN54_SULMK|nr:OmpA family protein [Sulfurospirillum multivorans]AHJ12521.1 OmpA domain-containing protein [Sulfurospirillum multivorans DSM 12446]QEH06016.1 OmpA domain-containing protein [Sulfurospirillum multivorans]
MRRLTLLGLCLGVVLLSGCASKDVQITLLPEDEGKVGVISVADRKGDTHTINKAYEALDISQKGEIASKLETEESVKLKYAEVLNALPQKPQSYLFFFSFDSAVLETKQLEELKVLARLIRENSIVEIISIGHSDSAGDKEYNKTLSLLRAKNVADKLAVYGVPKSLLQLQYYGDANPLDPTTNTKPNAKNRRVELILK